MKYRVYQDIKISMEEKFIEADSEKEARHKYNRMLEDDEVREMDRENLDTEVFEATKEEIEENNFIR